MADYHYHCPKCGTWRYRDWDDREGLAECPSCKKDTKAAAQGEDPDAWIDQYEIPTAMRDAVRALKGTLCTVPDCFEEGDHLDHRVPYDPGKTSVSNLFPMCERHNTSKGRKNYKAWLKELEEEKLRNMFGIKD